MRKFRFGLKKAFALVALIGLGIALSFGLFWYLQMRSARWEYERVYAARDAGLATTLDVCVASKAWLQTELRVPFSSRETTWSFHAYRVAQALQREEAIYRAGVFSDGGKHHRELIESIRREYYRPAINNLRELGAFGYVERVESAIQEGIRIPSP